MLLSITSANGTKRDVAIAVQESGFVWALDRDYGDTVWFKVNIRFDLCIFSHSFGILDMDSFFLFI